MGQAVVIGGTFHHILGRHEAAMQVMTHKVWFRVMQNNSVLLSLLVV
jgi:hypothetical protein